MRRVLIAFALSVTALSARAETAVDQLFDAMGMPAMVSAFAEDGRRGAQDLDAQFLQGQGGDGFADTIDRLHDPERLVAALRSGVAETLSPDVARQALVFFDTDMGARIVRLEVEARRAMRDDTVEAAALAAAPRAGPDVRAMLEVRDLVARNTDISMAAQVAFWAGLSAAAPTQEVPDIEARRDAIGARSRDWVTGYYMLVASALEEHDLTTYTAFWETDLGVTLDTALGDAFEAMYRDLSFATGQTVGRFLPENEL